MVVKYIKLGGKKKPKPKSKPKPPPKKKKIIKKKKKKKVKKKNPPFVLDTMGDVKPSKLGTGVLYGGGAAAAGAGVAGRPKPIERKRRGGRIR